MPKPCHLIHDYSAACPACLIFETSPAHRKLWGGGSAVMVADEPKKSLALTICDHRSAESIGKCAGCGGAPKYACSIYGETTAANCFKCKDHTGRAGVEMRVSEPLPSKVPPVESGFRAVSDDPTNGTPVIQERRPNAAILAKLIDAVKSGQAVAVDPSPSAANDKIEWVSTAQLARDTLKLIGKLPPDLAGIVGIPRSGMLPAAILATHLHLPLYQLTAGGVEALASGTRGSEPAGGKLLVIDDTVYRGSAMLRARQAVKGAIVGAVYVRPEASGTVDVFSRLLPSPHLCEWNLFNNGPLVGQAANPIFGAGVATDFDGILCEDPDVPDADDGPGLERYRQWLINAKPASLLPRKYAIPLIVTGRLERFRAETEEWLRRHRVKWTKLVMHPAAKASERGDVAAWKARVYGESGCGFFVESNQFQADRINFYSGKPTICPATETVFQQKKPGPTVREIQTVPTDPLPVRPEKKYPPITTRHLCYCILPIAGNGIWQRNLDQLIHHLPLFNGRKRVAILTAPPTKDLKLDPTSTVERYLAGRRIEFVHIANDPKIREVACWAPLLEPLARAKEDEAVFWGHAKAVTHGEVGTCWRWARLLYAINLGRWDLAAEILRDFPIAGAFMRSPLEVLEDRPTTSKFEFHGGFYWMRAAELFRRKWREIEQTWVGTETAPGVLFDPKEAGMIFPEKKIDLHMSLYHEEDMAKAEAEFEKVRPKPQTAQASPVAVPPVKYPPITTRHLCYVVMPVSRNGIWQRNLDQLIPELPLFNGRKRVAIITGSPDTRHHLDPPDAVMAYLAGHGCEFFTKANNPKLREGEVWEDLFGPLVGAGEDEAAFFGHCKGVTRSQPQFSGAHRWTRLMYRICLESWPVVEEMLTRFPICGPLKHVGVNFLKTPSKWQFIGSFYWIRLAEMFKLDWKVFDRNWGAVETWPGLHFSIPEGGAIFPESPIDNANVYRDDYWGPMEAAFAEWQKRVLHRRTGGGATGDPLSSLLSSGRYSTDKEWRHSYASGYYGPAFDPFRDRPIRLLEIGVQTGGSLKLWRDFLPLSEVVGVDREMSQIEPDVASDPRIKLLNADAYDPAFSATLEPFDIVIDDGSHRIGDQIKFIELYSPKVKPGGLLVIEDIQDASHFERLKSALPEKLRGRTLCLDLRRIKGRYDDLLLAVQY